MTQVNKQLIRINSIKELQKIGNDPDYPLDGNMNSLEILMRVKR